VTTRTGAGRAGSAGNTPPVARTHRGKATKIAGAQARPPAADDTTDAVANMAYGDAAYRAAGMTPR
jgi:hypothetical protein